MNHQKITALAVNNKENTLSKGWPKNVKKQREEIQRVQS